MLLFPVIAWYDIITVPHNTARRLLLFPVIAWYDIITLFINLKIRLLLFPVIAWYDIIIRHSTLTANRCCSQLSLSMI